MTRTRVLHTVGNLDVGGGQKLVALVAGSLDRSRYDVGVLSFGTPGVYSQRLRSHGVALIELGLQRPIRRNGVMALLRATKILLRTVVFGRWDIVHTHMFVSSVIVTPLARLGGARAMGTTHRIYYGRIQPVVERIVARLQERIVVDSYSVAEILREQTHIAPSKYTVIYNGIEVQEFDDPPSQIDARARLRIPAGSVVIGEIAHLAPHKGQRHLIDAMERLVPSHPDARLLIVGDGPDRADLERAVGAAGLQAHVVFAGARDDLAWMLMAIDVLALPSTFEGFGIVQAEAMYLERPVVATNHGGSTEIVEEGVTGYLVPFGDVEALVDRLDRLARDPSLRIQMGSAGRQRVLAHFTVQKMAAAYDALYRSLPDPQSR